MNLFYWDDYISCNSRNSNCHNVLDLNFNELLMDNDNEGEINFDNVSPKLHINMLSFEF